MQFASVTEPACAETESGTDTPRSLGTTRCATICSLATLGVRCDLTRAAAEEILRCANPRCPRPSNLQHPRAQWAPPSYWVTSRSRQDKSRKGGRGCRTWKPFIAIQRVRLPPGKGQPASRKRVLHGWWQHHS